MDLPVPNVLSIYFDKSVNQSSRDVTDMVRVVEYDEKGGEVITFKPFDSAGYQKELGPVDNWGLDALRSAGIDPRFSIHTSSPSRFDDVKTMQNIVSVGEQIINEMSSSEN